MLRFKSLGSGSSGNATIVQARSGLHTSHLLVDCGLGPRILAQRLALAGLDLEQVDAIFVTHEHSDHVGSACKLALRHRIPIFMSEGTHAAIGAPDLEGLLTLARGGEAFEVGALRVTPFDVPHDAREPLQLHCTDGDARLGILTDLGHVPPEVIAHLAGCRTLLLECNHDTQLLQDGPYPHFLKRRVGGDFGHLANEAAADAARQWRDLGLQQVVAAHLSVKNNRPDLARQALQQALGWDEAAIHVADAATGCDWLQA